MNFLKKSFPPTKELFNQILLSLPERMTKFGDVHEDDLTPDQGMAVKLNATNII